MTKQTNPYIGSTRCPVCSAHVMVRKESAKIGRRLLTALALVEHVKTMHEERKEGTGEHPGPREFQIQIDRVHYTVTKSQMTGAELRQLPNRPIGADRDLFEIVPGGLDRKIEDTDVVEIRKGKRVFTAPAQINPGRAEALLGHKLR